MLLKILSLLNNKYVIASVAFLIWLAFFDDNSLTTQAKLSGQLNDLKRQKEFYEEEIEKNREASKELMNNADLLEKFARENYLMKRESEDIYVIVRE